MAAKKINVLFPVRFRIMRGGGVANYSKGLFGAFSDNVNVLDMSLRPGEWKRYGEAEIGALYGLKRKLLVLFDMLRYEKLVRNENIHLVHLNPSLGRNAVERDIVFARKTRKAGVPFVVFFRGWDKTYESRLIARPKKLNRFVNDFGSAERIIVLGSEFRDKLVAWGFDERKIVIETTTVDDQLVDGIDITDKITRSCPNDPLNILFLARVEKAKGVYEAVDTYRILRQMYPSISMTLAGDGSELPKVIEYANQTKADEIQFLGWVDGEEKRKAYLGANLYLFPTSHGEGMPNSILEAMAFGVPIVTLPVGGITDFFENEKMGCIARSNDVSDLVSACKMILECADLRKKIAIYNHKFAMRRFLASKVSRRIEGIYEAALEDASRAAS